MASFLLIPLLRSLLPRMGHGEDLHQYLHPTAGIWTSQTIWAQFKDSCLKMVANIFWGGGMGCTAVAKHIADACMLAHERGLVRVRGTRWNLCGRALHISAWNAYNVNEFVG